MILETEDGRLLALGLGRPAAEALLSSPDCEVREAAQRFLAAYSDGDGSTDEAVAALRELTAVAERAASEADDEQV